MKQLRKFSRTIAQTLKSLFAAASDPTGGFGDLSIDLTLDEVMSDLNFGRYDAEVKPVAEPRKRFHYRIAA